MRITILALRNSIHTARWVNSLSERGYEIHLISMHPSKHFIKPAVIQHDLEISAPVGYYLNVWKVRQLLTQFPPDLLHAHYASGYGTLGWLSGFKPYIVSVWGSDVYEFPTRSSIHKFILEKNLSAAQWICSTSRAMAEQTLSLVPKLSNRLSVIPFGIDETEFVPGLAAPDPDYLTIGTVKTLAIKYGIDILIRAFAIVNERIKKSSPIFAEKLRLVIVGGPPHIAAEDHSSYLRELCTELRINDKVKFIGPVDHKEVPRWLNTFDIYSILSRRESFGVAVLEASACGLPVVVSDVGGLPEVVANGQTGTIVPSENPEYAAEALEQLIMDPSLRKRMGENGREYVQQNYLWEKNVDEMEKIYNMVAMGSF